MPVTEKDRLESWKEIADFLGRDARTVMRWAEKRGMPVHRVPGGKKGRIYGFRAEIGNWLRGGQEDALPDPPISPSELRLQSQGTLSKTRYGFHTVLGLVLASALIAIVAFVSQHKTSAADGPSKGVRQITHDGVPRNGLITDGSQLYFGERRNGRTTLAKASVDSGALEAMDSPPGNSAPEDISARGDLLAWVWSGHETERQLWIVPVRGSPRPVGEIIGHSAVWGSDNHTIYYAAGNSIFITADEGRTSRVVQSFDLIPGRLRISPDGSALRFLLCDPKASTCAPWRLFLTPAGVNPVATPIPVHIPNCCGDWTKSDHLGNFFVSEAPSSNKVWFVRGNHNFSEKPIGLDTQLKNAEDVASANGALFIKSTAGERHELLRFAPLAKSFTPFLAGVSATYVDFSPDGKWISYLRTTDQNLWTSRPDGSDAILLSSGADGIELPRWSPDGKQIAFIAKHRDRPWRIFIIPAGGGAAEEASQGEDSQGAPTWSPDGRELAYANLGCEETNSCAVHRIDLATKQVDTIPGSNGLKTARWSPDGRYVAALDFTKHTIRVFDLRKKSWKTIAESINGDDLSWARDSRSVYANREIGPEPGIIRFPITGGHPQTVVDLATLQRLSGSIFTWFCVAPDGSVLISRNLDTSDIYALDWQEK